MKTFDVNGKQYKGKKFDFNLVCDLEDMGVTLEDMQKKNLSLIRGYFGLCAGLNRKEAGAELQTHLVSGKKFESLTDVMSDEMEKSDFFRALGKTAETEDTAVETEEKQEPKAEQKKEPWEE